MDQQLRDEFQRLRKDDPEKLAQIISSLSDAEAESIMYDWTLWQRDKQFYDPHTFPRVTFWRCGRSWGKTRTGAEAVRKAVYCGAKRIAILAPTAADARDTCVLGESGLMNVFPPTEIDIENYQPSYRRVVIPKYNSQITLYSGEESERLRGPQHDFAWIDEPGSMEHEAFRQLNMGLRLPPFSKMVITGTPRTNDLVLELMKRKDIRVITGSTYENRGNVTETYFDEVVESYKGTRFYDQEVLGELLLDNEGALWTTELITSCRVDSDEIPAPIKCVIGVDPAISTNKKSDSTGIVVALMGEDNIAYVVADHTGKYSPEGWAQKVVSVFHYYRDLCPTTIVVESNQGGQMCRSTLERFEPWLPIKDIHHSSNKLARAQPIALMYEKGKVKHGPSLKELEQQQVSFDGTGKSPDRYDAANMALTELMPMRRSITKSRELLM